MKVPLVRPYRVPLNRKTFCNLGRHLLENRRHFIIQQRLAVFDRNDNMVMDAPRTVRSFSDLCRSLIRHASEGTREEDPRSK